MNFSNTVPLGQIIKEIQEMDNPLVYDPSIVDEKFVVHNRYSSKDKASFAYNNKNYTMSDLYIAMAVTKLNIGSVSVMTSFVKWYSKKHTTQAVIPADSIRNRIRHLLTNGLMNQFSLNLKKGTIRHGYYTMTSLGINIMKTILPYKDGYNEYASITPVDLVVKQLAANVVLKQLLDHGNVEDFSCNRSLYYPETGKHSLYVKIKTMVNEQPWNVIIEPFYFTFDTVRTNKEDFFNELRDRLLLISKYVAEQEAEGKKIAVIFACESFEEIKVLMKRIASDHLHMLESSYFTTSSMVHKYGLTSGLLRVDNLTEAGTVKDVTNVVIEPFC